MKNYIISTTRQWNCGDKFILFGVIKSTGKFTGIAFTGTACNL